MTDPSPTERLDAALSGRYKIERKLGEGGMASVYLAEDLKHERNVALKILRPELAAVIGGERFITEIKTTANLQHPHILPLFDSGEADGFLYYVMPYIEGETLREKLDREQQLGVEEAVRIARDVADALDYAHRHDVIHRDIKPANILLHDGRPVVADFGIALAISAAGGGRMTETGMSLGTPHYMSPEQASADRELSARSDVYSLGCVLYEMLTGQPPHTGQSAQSILVRILTEDPRPVTDVRRSVPPHVAATVMKSIEKLPADRFETAKAFMDALADQGFRYGGEAGSASGRVASARRGDPSAGMFAASGVTGARWIDDRRSRLAVGTAGLAAIAAVAALATRGGVEAPLPGAYRFTLEEFGSIGESAPHYIGPDGSLVVVGQTGPAELRRPGSTERVPLPGTEGAVSFAFSPDGSKLAYTVRAAREGERVDVGLHEMDLASGRSARLSPSAFDVTHWADDGYMYGVAAGGATRKAVRISEAGGALDTIPVPGDDPIGSVYKAVRGRRAPLGST